MADSDSKIAMPEKVPAGLDPQPLPAVSESPDRYEEFRADLALRFATDGVRMVVFSGAKSGCGTSTTAANFASGLASDERLKVLLIDANLRHPTQHKLFDVNHDLTLSGLVAGMGGLDAIKPVGGEGLYVLPNGGKSVEASRMFRSESFDQLLRAARERFNYVILDAPPLTRFVDARLLGRRADGVVLVVEAGRTRRRAAIEAKRLIEDSGARLLGVVLNRVRTYIPNWISDRL